MGKIKAIVFDMDGVLIEAKDWHYESLNKALRLFGYEISRYDHLVTYDGLPTAKKLEMLSLEKGLPVGLHRFINQMKQSYTIDLVHAKCTPKFFHEYALSRLRTEGYRLSVASNSVRQTVELMMKKSDLLQYMEFYLSNQDVTHAKPHPEIYTTAITRLGLAPDQVMVVEDNHNGIQAATAAGTYVMKVETVYDVNYENIVENIRHFERVGREEKTL